MIWHCNIKCKAQSGSEFFADYATISPCGKLTGVRPGEVMVVAMDADLNKEIWPVTVS